MALKKYRPTSPGMRQMVRVDRSELWKGKPEKSLLAAVTSSVIA
jgi:large subunit ribosomal protein L2